MKTIKLTSYSPEVFDDPEYCSKGSKVCSKFGQYNEYAWCWLFSYNNRAYTRLDYDKESSKFIKCDECKKHCELSKQIDETTNN